MICTGLRLHPQYPKHITCEMLTHTVYIKATVDASDYIIRKTEFSIALWLNTYHIVQYVWINYWYHAYRKSDDDNQFCRSFVSLRGLSFSSKLLNTSNRLILDRAIYGWCNHVMSMYLFLLLEAIWESVASFPYSSSLTPETHVWNLKLLWLL